MREEWYSTTSYEVKINPAGIKFLGTRVGLLDENLDDRMGWIRKMRLVVALNPYHPKQFGRSKKKSPEVSGIYSPVMQPLIRHLLLLPDLRLRYIDLVVAMDWETYIAHLGEKKDVEKKDENTLAVLQHNFEADFLKLKGVAMWRSWKFDYSRPGKMSIYRRDAHEGIEIEKNAKKFEEIAIPYFEQLAKRINPPKTEFTYLGKIRVEVKPPRGRSTIDLVMEAMDPFW
jgi:hypothetical protein